MSLLCDWGFHNWWRDCEKCARCGLRRKDLHKWDGPRCTKCRKTWERTFCLIYCNGYRGEKFLYKGDRVIYFPAERFEKRSDQYVFFDKQGAELARFPVYDTLGAPSELEPPVKAPPRHYVSLRFKDGCPECDSRQKKSITVRLEYDLADGPGQRGQWSLAGFVCPNCAFHWERVSSEHGPKPPQPDIECLVWSGKDKLGFHKGWVTQGCKSCKRKLTVHRKRCEDPDGPMYHPGVCSACGTGNSG